MSLPANTTRREEYLFCLQAWHHFLMAFGFPPMLLRPVVINWRDWWLDGLDGGDGGGDRLARGPIGD
jgi:hypothetical protein